MDSATVIRALTTACLAGLLLAVGLRLTAREVFESVRNCRLTLILLVNFVGVPLLVVGLIRLFRLEPAQAVGMILLGAAPFAPVVPVFAKMARADLALAAGLTALMPMLSAFLTPWVSLGALRLAAGGGDVRFHGLAIAGVLTATVTGPLVLGIAINQYAPGLKQRVLRPIEVLAEGTGALSLVVVTIAELPTIRGIGWAPLLAMVIGSELSFAMGYLLGGRDRASRRVVALGTSNRNLALALLLAVGSFAGTGVAAVVVANGLLLILLGLLHAALWHFTAPRAG